MEVKDDEEFWASGPVMGVFMCHATNFIVELGRQMGKSKRR